MISCLDPGSDHPLSFDVDVGVHSMRPRRLLLCFSSTPDPNRYTSPPLPAQKATEGERERDREREKREDVGLFFFLGFEDLASELLRKEAPTSSRFGTSFGGQKQ